MLVEFELELELVESHLEACHKKDKLSSLPVDNIRVAEFEKLVLAAGSKQAGAFLNIFTEN